MLVGVRHFGCFSDVFRMSVVVLRVSKKANHRKLLTEGSKCIRGVGKDDQKQKAKQVGSF